MKIVSLAFAALFLFAGCGGNGENASEEGAPGQLFTADGDYAGSHILVAYAGAMRAKPEVTRTKEEARAKAEELIARLQKDPSQFEELARTESDGPSGPQGGSLGTWSKGQMAPAFEHAVDSLEVGAITDAPVETPFGYHIIRRDPMKVPFYGAEAFLIGYKGSPRVPPTVTREQPEADSLAQTLKAEVTAENFDEYAAKYNDFGDGPIFLGGVKEGDPAPPELLETLKKLDYGEVGGPVAFDGIGYAFVRRIELERRAGAHILIAYQGAMRAAPDVTRTKEEAYARAKDLIAQLQENPDRFAVFAAEYSDGPSGPNGGDLGKWFKGQMVPAFDEAIDSLAVGEITKEPVETPFGYHIIRRLAVEE